VQVLEPLLDAAGEVLRDEQEPLEEVTGFSLSSSPASGNCRTTCSGLSSLSTSLTSSVAPARFLTMRRASPMGSPRMGGAIAGS